jgi:hypothetical protein
MTFYIILGALLSSHLLLQLPLKEIILTSLKSVNLSYKVITDKKIDDEEKEKLIASYSLEILKHSIKFIGILLICITPILVTTYYEYMSISLTLKYLFDLQSIFFLIIIFNAYLLVRKLSINGLLFKNR